MENVHEAWPNIEEYLLDELSPESILDFFMERNIFSLDDYEFLFKCTYERKQRSKEFLARIKNSLPEAISVLLHALKETNQASMVEDLENIIKAGATADGEKKKDEQKTCSGITVVDVAEEVCKIDGSVSNVPCITLVLKTKPDETPANEVEYAINRIINDKEKVNLLKIKFISSTGCVIEKSELGSVIICLRPLSRCSYEKLRDFCKSGGLKEFVLNILKEEEIIAFLPQGEMCIDVKVVCKQEESFLEGMDENKSMNKQSTRSANDDSHRMRGRLEMIRENIIINFEDITDEIDPVFFEKLFVDKGILNKQFFNNLRKTHRKRKLRAAVFLKEVLVKGGVTLIALIDALKEKGCNSLLDKLDPAAEELSSSMLPSTGAVIFKKEALRKTDAHSQDGLMWSCSLTIRVEEPLTMQGHFKKRQDLDSSIEERKLTPKEEGKILEEKTNVGVRGNGEYFKNQEISKAMIISSAFGAAVGSAVCGPYGLIAGGVMGVAASYIGNLLRGKKT